MYKNSYALHFCFIIFLFCVLQHCSFSKPSIPELSPEISIKYNSSEISPNQEIQRTDYSGNPAEISFIIINTGEGPLEITNILLKCNTGAFKINKEPQSSVKPGEQTEFIINYSSDDTLNSAQILIYSNDTDRSKFSFNISCRRSDIKIYFTGPDHDTSFENALLKRIKNQSKSEYMDLCLYGLNRESVIKEIESAVARGVHVRFAGNLDGNENVDALKGAYYPAYYRIANALDIHFPVTGKKRTRFPEDNGFEDFNLVNTSIMHNKFALFSDKQNNYTVTGSTNFTDTGFDLNNNNSIIINDSELFNTYREQFEYLLGLPGCPPVEEIRKFNIEDIEIEALFPPSLISGNTTIEHLIQRIDSAESSIYFMIFSFTHLDLINQFIAKFKKAVTVKGIFDESQIYSSSEELLSNNGIPCRSDGNYNEIEYHGGKLHHKTMILDDKSVITGSFNWSYNANTNNDENIMIMHSKGIADLYKNEWHKRWNEGREIVHTYSNGNTHYDYGNYQDIIINEVMWMGSRQTIDSTLSSDEFIELKNMTDRKINLTGWYLEGAARNGNRLYLENISIDANSMIVIMRRSKKDSAFIPENCFESSSLSISNSNLQIILKDPDNTIIDLAGNSEAAEDFSGYSDITKKSMARKDIPEDGTDPDNWFTTNTQVNISNDFSYSLFNLATPGADNSSGDLEYASLEIVLSEIAWAGTDLSYYDEWIEFYNNSNNDINLAGWSIKGSLNFELYGIIPANRHFLLERTNDDSVPEKTADFIYSGSLSNSGAVIRLDYNNRDIDYIDTQSGWFAGSNDPKISMERIDTLLPGEETNWQNGTGDIEGAENSAD